MAFIETERQNYIFVIYANTNVENITISADTEKIAPKTPTSESCGSFSYMSASAKPEKFVQLTPRQSLQPTEHSRPCLPQPHRLVSQFSLQLQRMVGSKFSDAGGRLVFTGRRWSCTNPIPSFLVQNLCC